MTILYLKLLLYLLKTGDVKNPFLEEPNSYLLCLPLPLLLTE